MSRKQLRPFSPFVALESHGLTDVINLTSTRTKLGTRGKDKENRSLPLPSPYQARNSEFSSPVAVKAWSTLVGGLEALGPNTYGRPWPAPRSEALGRAAASYPPEVVERAAREAREIVMAQDRAPNITGLFEKKLGELRGS